MCISVVNAFHEQHLSDIIKGIVIPTYRGKMEAQTGTLTFPWGLSPLVAYLRTQTRHPKVDFGVLSILYHNAENDDQNIEIITSNYHRKEPCSQHWGGV